MMKTIVTVMLAVSLGACSVTKSVITTSVHPETQHHIDENAESFVRLVTVLRANNNVKAPTVALKNEINQLVFHAGLIPQCTKTDGCYLVRPGITAKIRIEPDHILLDYSTSYVKIEDINKAVELIYG